MRFLELFKISRDKEAHVVDLRFSTRVPPLGFEFHESCARLGIGVFVEFYGHYFWRFCEVR